MNSQDLLHPFDFLGKDENYESIPYQVNELLEKARQHRRYTFEVFCSKTPLMDEPSILKEHAVKQVPTYKVQLGLMKTQDSCVVIPVINEGQRLHQLIRSMQELNVHRIADILIIDGGSSDGSINLSLLQEAGVRFVLEKMGPGKLSSQLRCAYSFALDQGYQRIITIDGNGKDDPEAIPAFIEHLEKGFDFVQASRYKPGGVAENTPKIRDFAIRYIHAPLLSYFSGFSWTDTTQGFRGYSRKMLLDPRVAPFRDIFSTYELLAYLSYRVPKLKFRCIELPTKRSYPEGEVPTKISSFKGNWNVLKILLLACTGAYNPR